MRRTIWIALLATVTVVAVAVAWRAISSLPDSRDERSEADSGRSAQYEYDAPEPGTYSLPVLDSAGDGHVILAGGAPTTLHELLEGRVTVLSFIYTRCADPSACPTATGVLQEVHAATVEDAALTEHLQLMTFSFDPDHDTPEVMATYGQAVRRHDEGSSWLFLTPSSADELNTILAAYGQRVDRRQDPDNPLGPFYHLLRVYLIDSAGRIRNIYSTGLLDPRLVLADVRTLLLEEARTDPTP